MRVVGNRAGIRAAMAAVAPDLGRRAQAVADACNASSSWGGYVVVRDDTPVRPRFVVINIKPAAAADESRNNRLLRNVSRGGG